jgi:hypothetical protein
VPIRPRRERGNVDDYFDSPGFDSTAAPVATLPIQPPPWMVPSWQGRTPPRREGANGFAIASFVLSLLWLGGLGSVLAIIFGHVALDRRHDWRGAGHRRMALAGLILGYAGAAVTVVFIATGSLYIRTTDSSTNPFGSTAHTPKVAPTMTDVETIGTQVTVYYDDSTGALSLTASGNAWKLTDTSGKLVGHGTLASADESVVSDAVNGPATWCIAVGSHGDASKTWSVNAQGDVLNATCPPNLIYA